MKGTQSELSCTTGNIKMCLKGEASQANLLKHSEQVGMLPVISSGLVHNIITIFKHCIQNVFALFVIFSTLKSCIASHLVPLDS